MLPFLAFIKLTRRKYKPLKGHSSAVLHKWECFSKHNVAFLYVTFYGGQRALVVEQARGAGAALRFLSLRVPLWSRCCRFTAFSSQRNEQYGKLLRYVSFIDRAALLLKMGYQRTTQERSHKEELFLNTSDMHSRHSFPALAVVTLIFLICSPTTSLLSCTSLNCCPGTALICCGFRTQVCLHGAPCVPPAAPGPDQNAELE